MEQHICHANSAGEKVNFFSARDLYIHFAQDMFTQEHPDLEFSLGRANVPYGLEYREEGAARSIIYSRNRVLVTYPWEQMNSGRALVYAAYPLIEFQRQMNGYVTAYSAAVWLGGKGTLLFGKIGAGKTSISVDLCRRHRGSLIGNDLAIVGLRDKKVYVKGGTKFFFLRHESVRRSLPDLLGLFQENPKNLWLDKIKVVPSDLGIETWLGESVVGGIFSVHVDEGLSSLYVEKDDSLATRLFLNENFSRYIRGSCIAILGGDRPDFLGYVPSYDSVELYEFRKKLIEAVMFRICYVSGPLRMVSDYIAANSQ